MHTHANLSILGSPNLSARAAARLLAVLVMGAGAIALPTSVHAQCPSSFAPAVNYASAGGAYAVAFGDFNADGKLDMQIANYNSSSVRCYLGSGTGTFPTTTGEVSVGTNPRSIAVGDFNGDGRPDFVTANEGSNSVSIRLGIGSGFTSAAVNYAVGAAPWSVTVGDFNGDGRADLAVANFNGGSVSVLLGNGNGTFAAAVNYTVGSVPWSVAVGDFNGDGRADLAVANWGNNNVAVLLGNGNGTFAAAVNYGVATGPRSVAVGDFNGDGRADVVTANDSGASVSVLLGNGNGTFATAVNHPTGISNNAVAVGDFNGDGRADLAVANLVVGTVSVLLGNGNPPGTFAAAVSYTVGSVPRSLAIGDFNSDGRPDVGVANENTSNVSVLLNNTAGNPLPVFTAQPVGQVVQAGASVSLTAPANFFGSPETYQWRRNGQPLSNGGNISGATTATLTINPVAASDMASYDVRAISDACVGVQNVATSTAAVLAVTTPVTINNDNCSAAKLIGNSFYIFNTGGATTDGPTEANLGFGGGDLQVHNDVWFIYAATCSGVVTVDLCTSAFNTKVAIYNGTSCPAAPNTAIAGNDDTSCETGDFQSQATFTAVAGGQYLIRVGGYQGAVGTAGMTVSCAAAPVCAADFNSDDDVTADDIFAFLDAWFAGCP